MGAWRRASPRSPGRCEGLGGGGVPSGLRLKVSQKGEEPKEKRWTAFLLLTWYSPEERAHAFLVTLALCTEHRAGSDEKHGLMRKTGLCVQHAVAPVAHVHTHDGNLIKKKISTGFAC